MTSSPVPLTRVEQKILLIRGQKVLLDTDLAELYGITTKRLNEQVKRNAERFPKHFMFQLTKQELMERMSQIATSNFAAIMGLRRSPYAFTEHGTLQAANVLNSPTAIKVSITIIEAFLKLRELTASQSAVMKKLGGHEKHIGYLFRLLKGLSAAPPDKHYQSSKIGFLKDDTKKTSVQGKRK